MRVKLTPQEARQGGKGKRTVWVLIASMVLCIVALGLYDVFFG